MTSLINEEILRNYATVNNINNSSISSSAIVNNILNNEIAIDNIENQEQAMEESMNEHLLVEFKKNVKLWLELDNQIKRLNIAIKERKKKKNKLNDNILEFMEKYNIEDLNTKEGLIKFKKTFVKTPLSQKIIKEKLGEIFENDDNKLEKVNKIFTDRKKIEKTRLSFKKLKV